MEVLQEILTLIFLYFFQVQISLMQGRNAVNNRGVRNGTSFLSPLTNGQVQSLVNLANFLVQNPRARVNFSYPSTQTGNLHPNQAREINMLFNSSFNIITTILINNGVTNYK